MPLEVSAEIERRLSEFVSSDRFTSTEDVLRAALHALAEQEKLRDFMEKNQEALEEYEAGKCRPLERDQFLSNLRARIDAALQ